MYQHTSSFLLYIENHLHNWHSSVLFWGLCTRSFCLVLRSRENVWSPGWTRGDIAWCVEQPRFRSGGVPWERLTRNPVGKVKRRARATWAGRPSRRRFLPHCHLLPATLSFPATTLFSHQDAALHQSQRVAVVLPIYGLGVWLIRCCNSFAI